jgi:hypothetical protein
MRKGLLLQRGITVLPFYHAMGVIASHKKKKREAVGGKPVK